MFRLDNRPLVRPPRAGKTSRGCGQRPGGGMPVSRGVDAENRNIVSSARWFPHLMSLVCFLRWRPIDSMSEISIKRCKIPRMPTKIANFAFEFSYQNQWLIHRSRTLKIQGVPKQADIFKSLIWDFLMIINYKFYFGEEDITFDILVDLMTLFQWGILKFTISKISKNQIFLWNFHKYCKGNSKMSK